MRPLTFALLALHAFTGAPSPSPDAIAIPGGEAGVGYDDLQYAPALRRVLVPAGRTGTLALIDPASGAVTTIAGFTGASSYRGGHGQGTTSAAELTGWAGFVVATDRGATALRLVDARARKLRQTVKLSAPPDYVRVVAAAREVWVSEPARKQLEVLRVEGKDSPRLVSAATISVADGPESLVIDATRGKAYSHTWKNHTFAVDLTTRKVVATWSNGCRASRGIALDEGRGLLFTGCAEGKVTVVNLTTSKVVATADTGPDVDSIGYAAGRDAAHAGHLYVPAGGSAELWSFAVAPGGALTLLGKVPTGPDAHTVAVVPGAPPSLFVGTPDHGAVLRVSDLFAASPTP
jgi:hypothetical protein